jgi:hypothetical protein
VGMSSLPPSSFPEMKRRTSSAPPRLPSPPPPHAPLRLVGAPPRPDGALRRAPTDSASRPTALHRAPTGPVSPRRRSATPRRRAPRPTTDSGAPCLALPRRHHSSRGGPESDSPRVAAEFGRPLPVDPAWMETQKDGEKTQFASRVAFNPFCVVRLPARLEAVFRRKNTVRTSKWVRSRYGYAVGVSLIAKIKLKLTEKRHAFQQPLLTTLIFSTLVCTKNIKLNYTCLSDPAFTIFTTSQRNASPENIYQIGS